MYSVNWSFCLIGVDLPVDLFWYYYKASLYHLLGDQLRNPLKKTININIQNYKCLNSNFRKWQKIAFWKLSIIIEIIKTFNTTDPEPLFNKNPGSSVA